MRPDAPFFAHAAPLGLEPAALRDICERAVRKIPKSAPCVSIFRSTILSLIGMIARNVSRESAGTVSFAAVPMFILLVTFFLTFGYLLANFERPVLGCIEADFCK